MSSSNEEIVWCDYTSYNIVFAVLTVSVIIFCIGLYWLISLSSQAVFKAIMEVTIVIVLIIIIISYFFFKRHLVKIGFSQMNVYIGNNQLHWEDIDDLRWISFNGVFNLKSPETTIVLKDRQRIQLNTLNKNFYDSMNVMFRKKHHDKIEKDSEK